ncbi:hypothetical protein SDC9_72109 [bioreactor metagenome]|uniref:GGDEF domain-containing protein n=1 Tax=bioreactor metagenome TaxID=1076179 RepID=A0A644YAH0_9ZZZZ
MSVLNTPCVALLCFALFRSGFLGLAPIARNKVFDVIDQGIVVLSAQLEVVDHNIRAGELLSAISPGSALTMGAAAAALFPDGGWTKMTPDAPPAEFRRAADGGYVSLKLHALGASQRPVGYVLVLTDISALRAMAERDPLTGAYNREGLDGICRHLLQGRGESGLQVAVLMIDLDCFKSINDTYGHLQGDDVLRDFVAVARSTLNREYYIARLGGDEFVILLPGLGLQEAVDHAETLRRQVSRSSMGCACGEQELRYTVSIGVADGRLPQSSLRELLDNADQALYRAKEEGRNATAAHIA